MIYTTLDQEKKQTRLLSLDWERITSSNHIHLELRVIDLDTSGLAASDAKHKYTALSYTWQPEHPRQTIYVNGLPFAVGRNLYRYLRCLCDESEQHTWSSWWIDAISINQDDLQEKADHIPLMRHIYSNCAHLDIWLGRKIETIQSLERLSTPPLAMEDVGRILSHPYFGRVWIVQEFLLSGRSDRTCSNVSVCAGKTRVAASQLLSFLAMSDGRDIDAHVPAAAWELFFRRRLMFRPTTSEDRDLASQSMSLSECIYRFGVNGCTDVRDRVYGFYGLVDDAEDQQISYTISSLETFMHAMIRILNTRPKEQVISHRDGTGRIKGSDHVNYNLLALHILSEGMEITKLCNENFSTYLHILDWEAEEFWLDEYFFTLPSLLSLTPGPDQWLYGIAYCHTCRNWLYKKHGTWYEWFHEGVWLNIPMSSNRTQSDSSPGDMSLPVSGIWARLASLGKKLHPATENERNRHISMLQKRNMYGSMMTIVEH